MARARTDVKQINADLMEQLQKIRALVFAHGGDVEQDAWAGIETFCAIGVRLIARSNPSKVRDIAMTVEISVLFPKPPDTIGKSEGDA